jgi:Recombinase
VLLHRGWALQAEGLSLQAMANRLHTEGVPTLSGKGRWQKGTISNLLAQLELKALGYVKHSDVPHDV